MEKLLMSVENSEQKLIHSTAESAPKIPGRREFFTYRDLRANESQSRKNECANHDCSKGYDKARPAGITMIANANFCTFSKVGLTWNSRLVISTISEKVNRYIFPVE